MCSSPRVIREKTEAAAKAAYETCYFTQNLRWEAADNAVQLTWIGIVGAALQAYHD